MTRGATIPMPVLPPDRPARRSRLGRWRVASLVLVHLIMIAHGVQWLIVGRTVSPIEPSESMETLTTGAVNAGFVFFAVALLLTLIFGRFVCGWACHFVAYQDLSRWLMGRLGIEPRPLRSRLLLWVPLGMALYMFVWPPVYRIWVVWRGADPGINSYLPPFSTAFITKHFWETFPGWVFAILSVGIAGFAIVYFLGAKGFCTYACPYGGFFALADRFATVRVRVNENCDHTGACSTACSSNVDVAEEVRRYGMVVNPGCMKCGDCLKACPNEALHWGAGRPAILAAAQRPARRADGLLPWWEELTLAALFLFFLLSWRGLYGGFPFLMSAGLAAILAFVTLLAIRTFVEPEVRLHRWRLRGAGGLTGFGRAYRGFCGLLILFTAHSGFVQYQRFMGNRAFERMSVAPAAVDAGFDPQRDLDAATRAARDAAGRHYAANVRWGLLDYPDVLLRLAWVDLLRGEPQAAEDVARTLIERRPQWSAAHGLLGVVLRAEGRTGEAVEALKAALAVNPDDAEASLALGNLLIRTGRFAEAEAHYRARLAGHPADAGAHYHLGALAVERGALSEAEAHLQRAIALDPDLADAHYQLGLARLMQQRVEPAMADLREAIRLQPGMAAAHYNLAVACFMRGDLAAARRHCRDALALAPDDVQAQQFAAMLARQAAADPAGGR